MWSPNTHSHAPYCRPTVRTAVIPSALYGCGHGGMAWPVRVTQRGPHGASEGADSLPSPNPQGCAAGLLMGSRIGTRVKNLFSLPVKTRSVKMSEADFPESLCLGSGHPTGRNHGCHSAEGHVGWGQGPMTRMSAGHELLAHPGRAAWKTSVPLWRMVFHSYSPNFGATGRPIIGSGCAGRYLKSCLSAFLLDVSLCCQHP